MSGDESFVKRLEEVRLKFILVRIAGNINPREQGPGTLATYPVEKAREKGAMQSLIQ